MKGRILIADPEEDSRAKLCEVLSKEGYLVCLAETGEDVLEKIQFNPIHVIIMDVGILSAEGHRLISLIKKLNQKIHIIVMSSDSSLELARKVRGEGIYFYAIKPLDFAELKIVVHDALKGLGIVHNNMNRKSA